MFFIDTCCDELNFETTGMGNFHQGSRMGNYVKYLETGDGRYCRKLKMNSLLLEYKIPVKEFVPTWSKKV